ncbi:hypothetical protein DSO57_1031341 [Entomophthora muscae]|uniref:Uncharacterized protein n=1 Tax=Entomophthora muscae TaxID=34485 RepID=A0ACC2RFE5_9FUNG|nr:hypothetical protein DSO57_1031341 [Entomophthora muscae]
MFGVKFTSPANVQGLPQPIKTAFLQEILTNTHEAIIKQAEQMKTRHNKELKKFVEFKIGQPILRFQNNLANIHSKKIIAKWLGPFIVVEVAPNHNYRLADMDGVLVPGIVNGSCLKVFERLI